MRKTWESSSALSVIQSMGTGSIHVGVWGVRALCITMWYGFVTVHMLLLLVIIPSNSIVNLLTSESTTYSPETSKLSTPLPPRLPRSHSAAVSLFQSTKSAYRNFRHILIPPWLPQWLTYNKQARMRLGVEQILWAFFDPSRLGHFLYIFSFFV